MSQSDSSVTAAFAAAQGLIRVALLGTVPDVANNLLMRMKAAATYHERSQLAYAQLHILENRDLFLTAFAGLLTQGVEEDIGHAGAARPASEDTDWQSISLVDEGQIEETIAFKRIGQLIGHAGEAELRELDGYASTLLGHGSAEPKRNPLRGDIIGTAIHRAIEKSAEAGATQKTLAHEFALAMARVMPGCYRQIIDAFKARGIRPVDLALRPADDAAGRAPTGAHPSFDQARRVWEQSWIGRTSILPPDTLRSWESSIVGRFGNVDPLPAGYDPESAAALLDRLMRGAPGAADVAPQGAAPSEADRELTALLRRLNVASDARGDFARTDQGAGLAGLSAARFAPLAPDEDAARVSAFDSGADAGGLDPASAGTLSGLVAVNLIRAHRDELERIARSRLDHLVIEVVGSLFDQILSDARVPPEMARQIARLQLPVLRVTLVDPRFFSSRRHPVRRFINRIASLACAFDDFSSGPGKELLARVSALVAEIVDGDFDRLDVYDAKLAELERFIAEETHAQVRSSDAAPTLRAKEVEWRVERSFGQRLRGALEPLALPGFVLDFLAGAWAQAIFAVSRREGSTGATALALRRLGIDLVRSLQPKRSTDERKRFVQGLPALMAGLTSGLDAIDWPKEARDAFFGELVALHMGSLKAAPSSALDHNMTLRQLDAAFKTPLPGADDAVEAVEESAAGPNPAFAEQRFTPEEGAAIGLVSEATIDWAAPAGAAAARGGAAAAPEATRGAPVPAASGTAPPPAATALPDALPTIDAGALDAPPAPIAEAPARPDESANAATFPTGGELREQLQLGFAYQLNLKGSWQKVRLTYMSPARNLFLFSHGAGGRETVSMTTRTLDRLCAAGRLRAFEAAYLIERATERVRAQLAALGKVERPAAA